MDRSKEEERKKKGEENKDERRYEKVGDVERG